MSLKALLTQCENYLGWVPKPAKKSANPFAARATPYLIMERALERAMAREGVTEADLALAIAYCRLKHIPITSPLNLLSKVEDARRITAAPPPRPASLDARQAAAVQWEQSHPDEHSTRWIGRLTRSVAAGLTDTLTEWEAAGRGQ